MKFNSIKYILAFFCLSFMATETVKAQFYYEDPCSSTDISTQMFSPKMNAYYTSTGRTGFPAIADDKNTNNGWLRLTRPKGYDGGLDFDGGYVLANGKFPSNIGVTVEFDFMVWHPNPTAINETTHTAGNMADGFSVFLFDGSITDSEFRLGRTGGCLGYLPLKYGTYTSKGLKGAYLGVGIDILGNFLVHSAQHKGQAIPTRYPHQIIIAGPGDNKSVANEGYGGFPIIKSINMDEANNGLGKRVPLYYYRKPANGKRPITAFFRRVRVEMTPKGVGMHVVVSMKEVATQEFWKVIEGDITTKAYENLRVGFAASTGSSHAYHEVRNVIIRTPGSITAVRQYEAPCYSTIDDNLTVNSVFVNATYTNVPIAYRAVADTLPPYFVPSAVTVSSGTAPNLNAFTTLPNGQRIYKYNVDLGPHANIKVNWTGKITKFPTSGETFYSGVGIVSTPAWDENKKDNSHRLWYDIKRMKPSANASENAALSYVDYNEATINATAGANKPLKVNLPAGITSVQWSSSKSNSAIGWTNISGATTANYTIPGSQLKAGEIIYYRCSVGGTCKHDVIFKVVVQPGGIS